MRLLDTVRSELDEWIAHMVRWFPGRCGYRLRYYYYRGRLAGCGRTVDFSVGSYIRECKNITIGNNVGLGIYSQIYAAGTANESIVIKDNVYLNSNVMINADFEGHIEIGNNCIIGPNVVFRTSDHKFASREIPMRKQGHKPGTIIVQDNVWIGANVSIIGTVWIGEGAIVGAGAVVTDNVDDFAIVAGVPAKQIGSRG
jgi:galactoside O-acetyltransferase